MLQSMGSQRVRHDLITEQQQQVNGLMCKVHHENVEPGTQGLTLAPNSSFQSDIFPLQSHGKLLYPTNRSQLRILNTFSL